MSSIKYFAVYNECESVEDYLEREGYEIIDNEIASINSVKYCYYPLGEVDRLHHWITIYCLEGVNE